eukprot:5618090-Pleurochrysis_carterae.AAC.1
MSLLAVHTNALLATPRAGKAAVHATASRGQPRNAQVQATAAVPTPRAERATSWPLGRIAFSLLPLAGSARRKTLETEVVKGSVWTHDQAPLLPHSSSSFRTPAFFALLPDGVA